ncbi:MAG: D-alanine--D-alanine ligase [Planctomycetes bacterium]|jgi:D-alanine-D-alanine ligase|nr:D-alanine--D-alanine ligase [Planctomycetota bacterium]HPY74049.1 D-alanine--D-alanine ligase family protein [Planctomycetota bacterium]HRU52501.1 D-alanine--D-alanine ligase family protein [Planctomycetota bacterium]
MKKRNVLLLCGGQSSEHEVSLTSASYLWETIHQDMFQVFVVLWCKDGKWYWIDTPNELVKKRGKLVENLQVGQWEKVLLDYTQSRLIDLETGGKKISQKIDVVFPILHGALGEDGCIQGLCKIANIPCVGSSVLSSAICMDKVIAKQILSANQIPNTPFVFFKKQDWQNNMIECQNKIESQLRFPIFVKPANGGSSVGVTKVSHKNKIKEAVENSFQHDTKVLIEQGIQGQELECAVLGNTDLNVSIVGEIIAGNEFYDYEAKYYSGKSQTLIPANIDQNMQNKIQHLAALAYKALDCAGFARIDFLLEKDTQILYINEINTIPGFTAISMYPKLMASSGISYQDLITKLIDLAYEV